MSKRAAKEDPKVEDDESKEEKKTTKKARTTKKATKKEVEGHQMNINKCVDKAHEGKSLKEIIKLPPSALQGLGNSADEMFAHFKITTIEDMAKWKFFRISRAIVALSGTEEKGKRAETSKININAALDKKWEEKPLKEIIKAPVSALQGLAKWADETLKGKTIKSLGEWKYFLWAEALVELAAVESDELSKH